MSHKIKPSVQVLLQQFKGWEGITGQGSHKVLSSIQRCRTSALGYHAYRCLDSACGVMQYRYHSCRNRHCPNCGSAKKEAWIEARLSELLPVKYYHMVFTVPHQLNSVVMGNRKVLFDLLFEAASYTLLKFGRDEQYLGAQLGMVSVLHTWGQQLSFHPHVHCIVSGGSVDRGGRWKEAQKAKHGILFPVKAMRMVYRSYFLEQLQTLISKGSVRLNEEQAAQWLRLHSELHTLEWIIDARQPSQGPAQVVEYLGRYTHKVAISNHRIKAIDDQGNVTFQYKDYADESKQKLMTLSGQEFLRRFEQHILPKGFAGIRSYGYLGNFRRRQRVSAMLKAMNLPVHASAVTVPMAVRMLERCGVDITLCPCCKQARLELLYVRHIKTGKKKVQRE